MPYAAPINQWSQSSPGLTCMHNISKSGPPHLLPQIPNPENSRCTSSQMRNHTTRRHSAPTKIPPTRTGPKRALQPNRGTQSTEPIQTNGSTTKPAVRIHNTRGRTDKRTNLRESTWLGGRRRYGQETHGRGRGEAGHTPEHGGGGGGSRVSGPWERESAADSARIRAAPAGLGGRGRRVDREGGERIELGSRGGGRRTRGGKNSTLFYLGFPWVWFGVWRWGIGVEGRCYFWRRVQMAMGQIICSVIKRTRIILKKWTLFLKLMVNK